MASSRSLAKVVEAWCDALGVPLGLRPSTSTLARGFPADEGCLRPGVDPSRLASWEHRFGFVLPESLKAWLLLSNGFYAEAGPLVHPLSAVGPMVPFARMPGLLIQPESWFELGNPSWETVCIDLAYQWPEGEAPLFTSGDDAQGSPPRIIAPGFTPWFLRLLHAGGLEYWFSPAFESLGDPWSEHRRRVSPPGLPEKLRRLSDRAGAMLARGLDDRAIASALGINRVEVEAITRHWQHTPAELAEVGGMRVVPESG